MGCLGTIFKFFCYLILICVFVGVIAGIIFTRKVLMTPKEVQEVTEQYRLDTMAKPKPVKVIPHKKRKRHVTDSTTATY